MVCNSACTVHVPSCDPRGARVWQRRHTCCASPPRRRLVGGRSPWGKRTYGAGPKQLLAAHLKRDMCICGLREKGDQAFGVCKCDLGDPPLGYQRCSGVGCLRRILHAMFLGFGLFSKSDAKCVRRFLCAGGRGGLGGSLCIRPNDRGFMDSMYDTDDEATEPTCFSSSFLLLFAYQ